jgi:TatD DNase family protein
MKDFMLIDTHCHLDIFLGQHLPKLITSDEMPEINSLIERAGKVQVSKIINVGCDIFSSKNSLYLSKLFPNIFATIGMHPTECNRSIKSEIKELKKLITESHGSKLVGIGEIGLDYFHQPFNKDLQKDGFLAQIELALNHNLPISIHTRGDGAGDDVLRILDQFIKDGLKGVIHCFQQNKDFATVATGWGFFLGIDGPIDYPKNIELRKIIKEVGLNNLVLETDAPFLPPQQYRGKKNEASYLVNVAKALALLFDVSFEEVANITSGNASKLFRL